MEIPVMAAWVGVAGLVVPSCFASAGYVYRTRQESKRSARKVLFYLLEIRHALKASLYNTEKLTAEYVEQALGIFDDKGIPIRNTPILEILVRPMIGSHIENMIDANKPEVNEKLLDQYEKALLEFAEVNPVGAYLLKGREGFETILIHNENYMETCAEMIFPLLEGNPFLEKVVELKEEVSSEASADLMSEMNAFVKGLSEHCGRADRKKCYKIINSEDETDFSNVVLKINDFADTMKEFISEEYLQEMEAKVGQEVAMPPEVLEQIETLKNKIMGAE